MERIEHGSEIIWYDPECFGDFHRDFFEIDYWREHNAIRGKSVGRNTTWFVEDEVGQKVLRHYYRGGMIGRVMEDTFLHVAESKSRAMAEFTVLAKLYRKGLPVPRPCAARMIRSNFVYRADIILTRIEGAQDLVAILKERELNAEQWQSIGQTIRRFHNAGLYHADLNSHNILLDDKGKSWLIDFDKCHFRQPGSWSRENMERLLRSFRKERNLHQEFHWEEQDWKALLQGYYKGS
ncbi:3-deoxy-D-manno-octulosonic-acid kinase [Oceanimonas sp. GK1]|uniref:3-deoxy-D-manno-octulosonic acid kinase n=1 Tax=Oceanimonas sp. (strain GK1 / IBRC-M 10197) TaxID=511062 RepID=UPI0002494CED|nr:3-deoxy-D-manno-octulosonic acid kinase [Oceanimonas sp. GK1]AEY00396.1 3-deoxy-D-manno-octulosonic-acid kinase [Oceanimonas sp. GK1]